MRVLFPFLLLASSALAAVKVEFDPSRPETGPFPNDFLTQPDSSQKTGRRVDMPLPFCVLRPSDCAELRQVNELDGFNPQARLTVKFNGDVNPDTLRDGLFYLWLDPAWPRPYTMAPAGTVTRINRVVYDPRSRTAYAKPDDVLEQGRRYAIIVTDAVKDREGNAVTADLGFSLCRQRQIGGEYCVAVSEAAALAEERIPGAKVVGGSVFTTLSGTAWLQSAREFLPAVKPSVEWLPSGQFAASEIRRIVWRKQVRESGNKFEDEELPFSAALIAQAGVGSVSFGKFRSPKFLRDNMTIDATPTGSPVSTPNSEEIHFHVFLPVRPAPSGGYPVLIAGHAFTDSRFGMPTVAALAMASRGYAVVAINAVGHGFGPESSIRITNAQGATVELPAPGRGRDIANSGVITEFGGCVVLTPGIPVGVRDCIRQTAADNMQLVRALREGIDTNGDGRADLDGSRISYLGQSLGAFYGVPLLAVEPAISAGVMNAGGAGVVETAREGSSLRPLLQFYLGARLPFLLNDGFDFDEQYTGRYQPVTILTKRGAADVQEALERLEWIESPGAASTYAPHLKSATLPGMPIKRVLFQIAWGDQTVPNPSNSLLIRAANMREQTSMFRNDWAREVKPDLPKNPHTFLTYLIDPSRAPIGLAAFTQAALFLLSDSESVPNVNPLVRPIFGRDLFETPEFLPEETNFAR